jgi:hypothetical protein
MGSLAMRSKVLSALEVPLLLSVVLLFASETLGADRPSVLPAETRAKYQAAAPLNHTVKITRTGSVLKLDYGLVGADGKTYSLWEICDRPKPTFSIYHDGVKVGGGSFEFG